MAAYYNEHDPYAAAWLRNLIAAGHIAAGEVDERSIVDVRADDLKGYIQCHFFAGIGVWSHALRSAGWPDDRPVWTGSCPCQPFSAAGKGEGTDDARHLWPEWFRLIGEHRPVAIFGEQVGAAIRHGWLDLVSADLEGAGYAVGAAVLGAHSVGAPHIRQRLFFVADAAAPGRQERQHRSSEGSRAADARECEFQSSRHGAVSGVALGDTNDAGLPERECVGRVQREAVGTQAGQTVERGSDTGRVGNTPRPARKRNAREVSPAQAGLDSARLAVDGDLLVGLGDAGSGVGSATSGFWSACDWLPCIDGKARPVEPGTFPLAHGATARVGRLRAYGNAVVEQAAEEFILAARAHLG